MYTNDYELKNIFTLTLCAKLKVLSIQKEYSTFKYVKNIFSTIPYSDFRAKILSLLLFFDFFLNFNF